FALALVLEKLLDRFGTTPGRRWLGRGFLAILVVVGVLDQTPKDAFCQSATWETDAAFVKELESALPDQAMIYQLPYRVFPEGARYDHLRLFMHSKSLRWSYPCMRSR